MNYSDHDFDRLFGEKLRQQTDLDFSQADWPKVATRLDAHDRRRWRVLPFWWLAGLTALLVLSNLGWLWVFQQKKNEPAEHGKTVVVRDTIFEKTTIERVDTVFKTVVVERRVFSKQSSFLNEKTEAAPSPIFSQKPILENAERPVLEEKPTVLTEKEGQTFDFPLFRKLPIDSPAPISVVKQLVFVPTPTADFQSKTSSFSWKPKWIAVGPSGGFLQPLAYRLLDRRGSVVGFQGEIGFSNPFSLTFDAAKTSVECRGYFLSGYGAGEYIKPPNYNLRLRSFEIKKSAPKTSYRLGLGFRERFFSKNRLHPFLGAGLFWEWERSYEIALDWYQPGVGGSLKTTFQTENHTQAVPYATAQAGLEWRIGRRLSWAAAGFYDNKLGLDEADLPSYRGLKTWISWRF